MTGKPLVVRLIRRQLRGTGPGKDLLQQGLHIVQGSKSAQYAIAVPVTKAEQSCDEPRTALLQLYFGSKYARLDDAR